MTEPDLAVGRIFGVHGIKGLLKIELLTDFPERFKPGSSLWLDKLKRPVTILGLSQHKGFYLLQLAGIDDRNAAEPLVGGLLLVAQTDAMPLPQDTYYHWQLVGLQVLCQGQPIGTFKEVYATGASDIYVIARPEAKDLLLPARKEFIKKIDLAAQTMEVVLPEGLADL